MDSLCGSGVRSPSRKAGDPGSNPRPGENFSLKLTRKDLSEGYSEKINFHQCQYNKNPLSNTLIGNTSPLGEYDPRNVIKEVHGLD